MWRPWEFSLAKKIEALLLWIYGELAQLERRKPTFRKILRADSFKTWAG